MQTIPAPPSQFDSFEKAYDYIYQRDGVSRTDALIKARKEYPFAFARWQAEGAVVDQRLAKSAPTTGPSQAQRDFDKRVQEIVSKHGLSRVAAMSKARRELTADQWKALQSG